MVNNFAGVGAKFSSNVAGMSSAAGMPRKWTVADSAEIYGVKYLGQQLLLGQRRRQRAAHPAGPDAAKIDLKELVDEVRAPRHRPAAAHPLPRHPQDRIVELNEAFRRAIAEYGYKGVYRGVYPIKVNQHRYVVEEIVQFGRALPLRPRGRAPSRSSSRSWPCSTTRRRSSSATATRTRSTSRPRSWPRSSGARSSSSSRSSPSCRSSREIAKKIGRRAAHRHSRQAGGASGSGAGRPRAAIARSSASSTREVVEAIDFLRANDLLYCFELLHFHLGSQISAIRSVKNALREAGRFYVELAKMGAPLKYLDVGRRPRASTTTARRPTSPRR